MRTRKLQTVTLCGTLMTLVGVGAIAQQSQEIAEPSRVVIVMPDYRLPRNKWLGQQDEFRQQLVKVAEESMKLAIDERLTLDLRIVALNNLRLFSAEVAAEILLKEIEYWDNRGVGFSGPPLGEYPVVTLLEGYGPSVVPYLILELLKTESTPRRKLICDTLERVLGLEKATLELKEWAKGRRDKESKNLSAAIAELESRGTPAPK